MRKFIEIICSGALVILLIVLAVAYTQNGNFNVKTNLAQLSGVSSIKAASNDSFKTITQRCQQSGIPSSSYGECCSPPVYWLNPSCPYQMKGQDLEYNPKQQFSTDEESQAYQSVIDCMGANPSGSQSCQSTPTINNLLKNAKNKTDQCTNSCESTYQSCTPKCTTTVGGSGGDGPYQDSRANAGYWAGVQCLRSGSYNCLHAINSYVPTSWVHDIMQRAMDDVDNGTVWQAPAAQKQTDQDCLSSCDSTCTTCKKACSNIDDLKSKISAAVSKALADWQSAMKTPLTMPQPKPLTSKLNNAEANAPKITSNHIVDQNGKELAAQDVLKGGLSDSLPVVTLQFPLKDLPAGKPFDAVVSAGPPEAFPVEKIILTPDQAIGDGTLTVTIGNNTKPELFIGSGSAPGPLDYAKPTIAPDYSLYENRNFIRIDAKIKSARSNQIVPGTFSDILFSVVRAAKDTVTNPLGTAQSPNPEAAIEVIHFNKNSSHWDELPTEKSLCYNEGSCKYVAESPGASTFAMVIKKKSSTSTSSSPNKWSIGIEWLFLALWIGAIIYLRHKFWAPTVHALKKAESKEEKGKILQAFGFGKYVLWKGILLIGNPLALFVMILVVVDNSSGWINAFVFLFMSAIFVGFLFGSIMWLVLSIKYRSSTKTHQK